MHSVLPNHWLPVSVLAFEYGWSKSRLAAYAALMGLAHSLSTILAGAVVYSLGKYTLNESDTGIISFVLFSGLGLYYILTRNRTLHTHSSAHLTKNRPSLGVLLTLVAGMFFSPCVEMQAIYLRGSHEGLIFFIQISLFYTILTVGGIALMSLTGKAVLRTLQEKGFLPQSRLFSGILFILIGVLMLFLG